MEAVATPLSQSIPPKKRVLKFKTWEFPKGTGIKIAEMPVMHRGKPTGSIGFQVRVPARLTGSKREMVQFPTKAEAEKAAEDRLIALRSHGTEFAKIPAKAQRTLAVAWSIFEEQTSKTGTTLDLLEVVRAGIRVLAPTGGLKTLADVAGELRASKASRLQAGTLDASTERDYRRRSELLDDILGRKNVSEITAEDIEVTLKKVGAGRSARSILNFRNTLAETLRHAKSKRYCSENPMEHLTREAYKALGGKKAERNLDGINILKLDEARRLLTAAQEQGTVGMFATVVLRLFCGLRTKEASLLDWSEVHWLDPKPFVHIAEGKAKKRRIRHVAIPENALAWLKLCNPPSAGRVDPLSPKTYCKRFGRIAEKAGIGRMTDSGDWESEWENNDTRHSFGSYHYALHGDSIRTAKEMGHKQDDDVLFAHYRTLVRQETAKEYFSILPPTEASNVTEFPQAQAS